MRAHRLSAIRGLDRRLRTLFCEAANPTQMPFSLKRLFSRFLHLGRRLGTSVSGYLTLARSDFQVVGKVNIERHVRLRVTDGGSAVLQDGVSFDRFVDVTVKYGQLEIGARSYIGSGSVICARDQVTIGTDCLIAEYVTIRDQDHRFGPGLLSSQAGFTTAPVKIGNNVWIGAKATVTKGVTIGDNVVIGANSVVARDIPSNCVAVGMPARVIRDIKENE